MPHSVTEEQYQATCHAVVRNTQTIPLSQIGPVVRFSVLVGHSSLTFSLSPPLLMSLSSHISLPLISLSLSLLSPPSSLPLLLFSPPHPLPLSPSPSPSLTFTLSPPPSLPSYPHSHSPSPSPPSLSPPSPTFTFVYMHIPFISNRKTCFISGQQLAGSLKWNNRLHGYSSHSSSSCHTTRQE